MRKLLSLFLLFSPLALYSQNQLLKNGSEAKPFSAYTLVWSDEFNGNGMIDTSKWFHQTQLPDGVNWYNGEQQHYTNRSSNSFVYNGNLNIVAKREPFNDQGQTKQFTSARLNSKFAFQYGRVEVRAKLPVGAGTWPAIWMLGKNINEPGGFWQATHGTTNWPACGEIDIMEHWGTNQNVISSAVHHPINGNLNVGEYISNAQFKPGVSTEFNIYSVEWNEESITFFVNGIPHLTYNPSVKNQYTWPFDKEQYILLNVAIEPSVTGSFSQSGMQVDYVRVYQDGVLTGMNDEKYANVKIYPNPVSDRLNVQCMDKVKPRVEIYSMLGQKVYEDDLNEEYSSIDMEGLEKGMYVVYVISEKGRDTYKIIKK